MIGVDVQVRRKTYAGSETPALSDFRLRIEPGEFVALVGPSGAGKSTLLNIVGGLDSHVDGDVLLDGSPLRTALESGLAIGHMFQEPRLMPWLTVLQNLLLVLVDSDESGRRAMELLHRVGLTGFAHVYPRQLSGGMSRRLSLARAFAVDPNMLLMDEPFVSVDAPTAARLRGFLTDLWVQKRPTVLFVTHDLREALALADRVVFMSGRPGRVVLDQPVALPRPRDPEDASVTALREQLLSRNPDLLSGLETHSIAVTSTDPNTEASA
jgi:NitT/TauT family transport system ATP-binding protein